MQEYESLRTQILNVLERDLLGPYMGEEEELELELDETPLKRYLTGVLFTKETNFEAENDDGGIGQESVTTKDDTEMGLAMSNSMSPACFGISFACPQDIQQLEIKVSLGQYKKIDDSGKGKDGGKKNNIWKRIPCNWEKFISINSSGFIKENIKEKLFLRGRIRPSDSNGVRAITLVLVNEGVVETGKSAVHRCEKSFFQVHLSVNGIKGIKPFVERRTFNSSLSDDELFSMQLLYRSARSYAMGHGCSVEWSGEEDGKAAIIETSFIPKHPVFPLLPPDNTDLPVFSVRDISEANAEQMKKIFDPICQAYNIWINKREKEVSNLPENLQDTARRHLKYCIESSKRISKGINSLTENPEVLQAFQLAHRAMLYQFAHSELSKKGWPAGEVPKYKQSYAWYPFQIAFILQCLESIVNQDSEDKNIVDLLWFPTGGGKTEAYLGLTAFVLFLRRLRSEKESHRGGGTAVITRYTLRLLTVDQFYRTALLACACEKVRTDYKDSLKNTAPVSIGLWVGGEASPNKLKDAQKALEKIQKSEKIPLSGDPLKLKECPWCGKTLGPADYSIVDMKKGMIVRCPAVGCYFNKGLPVWLVDEDVYRERPSIIIGTVDKFARIPWLKEAGYIFGSDGKDDPPDLIIQDELHLISGPLGTLAGLYETAIDLLCTKQNGDGPKIIASTATIRNASNQVKNLFAREVRQFPQPGLDYRDSFFARENTEKSARLYAGVFAPGFSPTTALVRTFGCLLHAVEVLNFQDEVKDPYRTLMGYFNSLRELGGARRQVEDDVRDYISYCAKRDSASGKKLAARILENVQELTSRVNSSELDDIRKLLWERYPDGECLDVVLATNMISVGLDVPRLGLMSVVGQPKTTSEYIQATSRVGRKYPGFVVMLYNWTRSRDRSHYERFKTYHSRLYSEVEATSVTPFSSRARDRGLHAVIISLIRHLVKGMAENTSAREINPSRQEILQLIKNITDRIDYIDDLELNDSIDNIESIIEKWASLSQCGELSYSSRENLSLLKPAEQENVQSFPTLNSLRNIDQSAGLYIKRM